MRLVNWLLLCGITSLFFWAASLDAQQNGNLPTIRQSCDSALCTLAAFLPDQVQSGNLVHATYMWDVSTASSGIGSCSDTNGHVTFTVGSVQTDANCTGNFFAQQCGIQDVWGTVNSTGAVNLSCSFPTNHLMIFTSQEIAAPGGLTVDTTAQNTASYSTSNPSISVTTTQQNDVLFGSNGQATFSALPVSQTTFFGGQDTIGDITYLQTNYSRLGAAGASSTSWRLTIGGTDGVMTATAFKPTNLVVGTTKLPDGGTANAYSAAATSSGGSGAITFSLTTNTCSGLSISGATISGTPNVAGPCNIKIHATDGTHTADSATMALNIGSTLQNIQNMTCRTFTDPTPATASLSNISPGDPLYLFLFGDDQHGDTGYVTLLSRFGDSFGDTYFRFDPGGGPSGAIQVLTTTATQGGTVSPTYSGVGGSPLAGAFCTAKGAQQLVDTPVVKQDSPGPVASASITNSITTTVANGTVCSLATMNCGQGGGGSCNMTATTASPFTQIASVTGFAGTPFTVSCEAAPTATSYSATSNYTDSTSANMTRDPIYQTLIFLRPAPPQAFIAAGEKKRRHPE